MEKIVWNAREDLFESLFHKSLDEFLGIIELMSPESQKDFAKFLARKHYTIIHFLENMTRAGYITADDVRLFPKEEVN